MFVKVTSLFICIFLQITTLAFAQGNIYNDSFNKAKRILEEQIYFDHRVTLYCQATFDENKNAALPTGFLSQVYKNRLEKIEWEHVVPAENFGQTFKAWREGDPLCVDNKGKAFKGRNCAGKVSEEYRFMEADMYNLYPAIGAVNAYRQNYNFQMLPWAESDFGTCEMKIEDNKAEPPENARGSIARTYLYMDDAYSNYSMSDQQRKLMEAWDSMYPVDEWECIRAERIKEIQGNVNWFVESKCE